MPDISISEDQHERLRWVQSRLAEDIEYGHVRPCDALEYLLDRLDDESGEIDVSATLAESDADPPTQALDNGAPDPVGGSMTVERVESSSNRGANDGSSDSGDSGDSDDSDRDGGSDDPETTLNSMMSLLEDNADVWRESSAGEEKYEVDLPDGSTERARTKDDVRALLFKHHR